MKMKCFVLDRNTYKLENGKVFETRSRPAKPAPDGKFNSDKWGWHDIKGEWMPFTELDKPYVAEIGE